MSRQSKLTDDVQELYVRAVSAGVPPEVAARHAGFAAASLYRWLKGSTPRHAEFRGAHERALASFEIRLTATVSQAALTDPRWAMELLERRFPGRWARSRTTDTEGDPTGREEARSEAPIVLDPALLGEIVPRLLEAGRMLSGRQIDDDLADVSDFEDDGTDGDPHERGEPQEDEEREP